MPEAKNAHKLLGWSCMKRNKSGFYCFLLFAIVYVHKCSAQRLNFSYWSSRLGFGKTYFGEDMV